MTRSVLATVSFRKIWYMRTRPSIYKYNRNQRAKKKKRKFPFSIIVLAENYAKFPHPKGHLELFAATPLPSLSLSSKMSRDLTRFEFQIQAFQPYLGKVRMKGRGRGARGEGRFWSDSPACQALVPGSPVWIGTRNWFLRIREILRAGWQLWWKTSPMSHSAIKRRKVFHPGRPTHGRWFSTPELPVAFSFALPLYSSVATHTQTRYLTDE